MKRALVVATLLAAVTPAFSLEPLPESVNIVEKLGDRVPKDLVFTDENTLYAARDPQGFRPLVIGGILAFGLAVGSAYAEYDYQMLFGAAAILVSYIIPAYILRNRNSIAKRNAALHV